MGKSHFFGLSERGTISLRWRNTYGIFLGPSKFGAIFLAIQI